MLFVPNKLKSFCKEFRNIYFALQIEGNIKMDWKKGGRKAATHMYSVKLQFKDFGKCHKVNLRNRSMSQVFSQEFSTGYLWLVQLVNINMRYKSLVVVQVKWLNSLQCFWRLGVSWMFSYEFPLIFKQFLLRPPLGSYLWGNEIWKKKNRIKKKLKKNEQELKYGNRKRKGFHYKLFYLDMLYIFICVICVLTFVGKVELLHIPFHFISSVQNSCENIKITDFL